MDDSVEGIGQDLKPYGLPEDAESEVQYAQWSFRLNYEDVNKVLMFVQVTERSVTTELFSELNKSQVENLRDWLTRVATAMSDASPPPPRAHGG